MTHRNLFRMAALAVLLSLGGGAAFADRLGGAYRGPEDAKTAEKEQSSTESEGGSEPSTDSGNAGGGEADSGGFGEGGGEPAGGGGEEGGGEPGAPDGGGDSGSDLGGGSGGGESANPSGGSPSSGGESGAGGAGGGRGKSTAAAQEQFQVVTWYFEHNREQLFQRALEKRARRVQAPSHSSVALLGVLPRDTRVRSEITTEDRTRIFDILKRNVLAPESVVRDAAVIALGKLGTPEAVEVLKARVNEESATDVKQDTLLALGLTRSPEAVPVLQQALSQAKLVPFALLGLGLVGDSEQAGPVVLNYFVAHQKKGIEDNLASAACALGALGHTEAVGPLAAALKSKAMPENVRAACALALGRIGGDDARKALESALGKSELEVERAAALALGYFGDASVMKALDKEGMGKPDPLASGFAAVSLGRVLGRISADEWKDYPKKLREIALADKKDRVRSQYANLALAMCDGFDKDCRRFFTETLDGTPQKDMASALAISASLGNLGMAAPALTQWVGDAGVDSKARGYAAMAMGILGQRQGDDVAKALRDAYAKDEDANLRRGVVLGLGFVGDRDDVPFLLDVIAKADSQALSRYTRGSAATALGMIRDGESIARIAGLMSRPDPITRAYAIAALGCVGDKDPVPAMTKLFENCNFRRTFPTLDVVKRHL